ncbi:flavin reductase like domain-containing protein [Apiospora marii]|uniref:Flavin reductase like domain-containing protein n=1 Tax=Apiospora marii TaxID=335849 RepID=A0ABR1R493_9PEZI
MSRNRMLKRVLGLQTPIFPSGPHLPTIPQKRWNSNDATKPASGMSSPKINSDSKQHGRQLKDNGAGVEPGAPVRNLSKGNSRFRSHKINADHFKMLMRHVPRPAVVVTSVHYPQMPVRPAGMYDAYNDMNPEDQKVVQEIAKEEGVTLDELLRLQWVVEAQFENKSQEGRLIEEPTAAGPVPRAMTVSSFSSVTLDPRPTVTFSITKPSRTYDAIANSRRFNIHVLCDDENGARLAHHFTKGNAPTPGASHNLFNFDKFPGLNVRLSHGKEDWEHSWQKMLAEDPNSAVSASSSLNNTKGTANGVPCLQGDAVLYVLRCVVAPKPEGANGGGLIDVGGSAIVVGEIEDFIHRGDAPDVGPTPPHDAMSLTYAHQEYRKMGDKLEHGEPQEPKKSP